MLKKSTGNPIWLDVLQAFAATVLVVVFAALPFNAEAAIINGSFDDPSNDPNSTFNLTGGSTAIPGWTVTPSSIDWISESFWEASDGNRSLDLNGLSAGGIEQTVTGLTIGSPYVLEFDMAGNPDSPSAPAIRTLNVLLDGVVADMFSFDTTGQTRLNMGWEMKQLQFIVGATSVNLKFESTTTMTPFGPALDNVRLTLVPLPAALPLMGTGLAVCTAQGF